MMKYGRRQLTVKVTVYTTYDDDGRFIEIYSHDGVHSKVCEWAVWDGVNDVIASGICYGVKAAKQAAEQVAKEAAGKGATQ